MFDLSVLTLAVARPASADDLIYRYEGNVLPYDGIAGWIVADACESPCQESIENGRFVLHWPTAGDFANYDRTIATSTEPQPASLWVEWRYRSNHPLGQFFTGCDGRSAVHFGAIHKVVYMYGDGAVSIEGGDSATGLALDEFHTYRFESPDGISYRVSVDGSVFIDGLGGGRITSTYIQFSGRGGCTSDWIPNQKHEWDFIRYGTMANGEKIVASAPPSGFLDARTHAELDRFTVTYDAPNYAYIDEITVEGTGGDAPAVIQTLRRKSDGSETVEIVLDRPIPMGETVRFTFDDGVAINVVEFKFAPADTDGDGDADLHDLAVFQECFAQAPPADVCRALDLIADDVINLADHAQFESSFAGP